MKYYIKNSYGFLKEISKDKYYSLRRRKNIHEGIGTQNGIITMRYIKL